MSVLTHNELKQKSIKKKEDVVQENGQAERSVQLPDKKKFKEVIEYIFLYPEIPQGGYVDRTDIIELQGKKYKRICINNVVKTRHKVLADYLKSKGWECLDEVKVKIKNGGKNK